MNLTSVLSDLCNYLSNLCKYESDLCKYESFLYAVSGSSVPEFDLLDLDVE